MCLRDNTINNDWMHSSSDKYVEMNHSSLSLSLSVLFSFQVDFPPWIPTNKCLLNAVHTRPIYGMTWNVDNDAANTECA